MRVNPRAVLRPVCWSQGHSLGFVTDGVKVYSEDEFLSVSRNVEFGCRRCRKVLDIDNYDREEVLLAMERRKAREDKYREMQRQE